MASFLVYSDLTHLYNATAYLFPSREPTYKRPPNTRASLIAISLLLHRTYITKVGLHAP